MMTDEQARLLTAAAALDDPAVRRDERFGNRRTDRMYADMNKLRQAIRSEGSPLVQAAWDRVEECIDFAYGGCPSCRATHAARPSQGGDERVARLVEAAKQQGAEQMRDYIAAHFSMRAALAQRSLEPKPSRASVKYRIKRKHADAMQSVRDIVGAMTLPAALAAMDTPKGGGDE